MRFAVHRPGIPVASPRFDRTPCGNVPGCVYVGVAGITAGGAAEEGLALAALPIHTPACRAPLARNRAATFSIRPGAFSSSRRTSSPHPERWISRFNPAFAATFRPGTCTVPRAERVIALTFRFSTRITSNRRARSVEVFSHQSLRRSASRAFSRATALLTEARLFDPRLAIASLRSSRASRACSAGSRPGQCSISPVDSAADTATPRSIPTTSPFPGAATAPGIAANAICHRPPLSRATRYDFTPSGTGRDKRNRTHPAFGTLNSAQCRLTRRTSDERNATMRNPSFRPAFRQDGRP